MISSYLSTPESGYDNNVFARLKHRPTRLIASVRISRWSQASLFVACLIAIVLGILLVRQPWPHYEPIDKTGYSGVEQAAPTLLTALTRNGTGNCTRIGSQYSITISMQEANSVENCLVSPSLDFDNVAIEVGLAVKVSGGTAGDSGLGAAGMRMASDSATGDYYDLVMSSQNGFQVNSQVGLVPQEKQILLPLDVATLNGIVTHDIILVSTHGIVRVWVDRNEQPNLRVDDVTIGQGHLHFFAQVGPSGSSAQLDVILSSMKVWTL